MPARLIFLGTPQFAAPSLRALAGDDRFAVVLVVTQPDRRAGRGRKLKAPPVATVAEELGLEVFQPESFRDPAAIQRLSDANPDLLVLTSYGEILRRTVLNLAPGGVLNIHPSLLPKYRGASPVAAAILNGDEVTGVSIIKLVPKLDAGPILESHQLEIEPSETAGQLSDRLADLAAQIIPDVCQRWLAGEIEPQPQDDEFATYTGEWSKDDGRIDWNSSADSIERLVRAAQPWPVAWTTIDGQQLRIHSATVEMSEMSSEPGIVAREQRTVQVATGAGSLILERVQPAGKREMDADAWWNGLRIENARLE